MSPYTAQLIGEQWGHGEDKNTAAQLTAHAILGATLAYVNGANPAAGGSAAVAAEYAADYFSQKYNDGKTAINPETGQFDPNLLPENVKSSIRDLTSAIGAVVGGTVGDSAFNAQLAGVVGQNAVENNNVADSRNASALGKTQAQMAKEYVDAERKRSCGAVGLSANSEACNRHLRKGTSDTLGNLSEGATVAGLYPTPASPYLLGGGAFFGAVSTLMDDEKTIDQRLEEVGLSMLAGAAAGKVVKSVKTVDGDRLYSETVERIFSETSGKIAEKVPGAIKECDKAKEPKPIGCGK